MMRKVSRLMVVACGVAAMSFGTQAAYASDGAELAKKNGCMACHSMDKKVMGPAFKEVAKKYKGNGEALGLLTKKIKEGGSGVWGPIPMPAHSATVNEADIKTLASWVLASN